MKHGGIFRNGGVLALLLFNEVSIVDDGCQRRLDVMGHIGDQLRLHPLALQPLFHSCRHSLTNAVQVFAVFLIVPQHPRRVYLIGQISRSKSLSAFLELPQHQSIKDHYRQQNNPHQCPDHHDDTLIIKRCISH